MKRLVFLLSSSAVLLGAAELSGIRSVYIMPMSRGLDQYLANRLAGAGVFQVVTDPKLADAVFTDRIGEAFQIQLEKFSPTPAPPAPEKKAEEPEKAKKSARKSENPDDSLATAFATEPANKVLDPALTSAFGRSKGTVFLVHAKSREVVWSAYEPPRSTANKDLDRTASDIVSRLRKDLSAHSKELTKGEPRKSEPKQRPAKAPAAAQNPMQPDQAKPAVAPQNPAQPEQAKPVQPQQSPANQEAKKK